jgi:hypothetical protein
MAERNPVVEEWISKAEGDWDWTEIDVGSVTARMRDGYVYHLQQGQTFQRTHDLVMNRYPGFDTSTEELQELKGMASAASGPAPAPGAQSRRAPP